MAGKLLLAAGAVLSFAVTGAAIPLPEYPRPDWERAADPCVEILK